MSAQKEFLGWLTECILGICTCPDDERAHAKLARFDLLYPDGRIGCGPRGFDLHFLCKCGKTWKQRFLLEQAVETDGD
jgi:hypothetical protein